MAIISDLNAQIDRTDAFIILLYSFQDTQYIPLSL